MQRLGFCVKYGKHFIRFLNSLKEEFRIDIIRNDEFFASAFESLGKTKRKHLAHLNMTVRKT